MNYKCQAKILFIIENNSFRYMYELLSYLKKNYIELYDYFIDDIDFHLSVQQYMFRKRTDYN